MGDRVPHPDVDRFEPFVALALEELLLPCPRQELSSAVRPDCARGNCSLRSWTSVAGTFCCPVVTSVGRTVLAKRVGLGLLLVAAMSLAGAAVVRATASPALARQIGRARATAGPVSTSPTVLVPNSVGPFSDTFDLGTASRTTQCLVRLHAAIVEPNLWNLIPSVRDGACAETTSKASPPTYAVGNLLWKYNDDVLTMDANFGSTYRGGTGPIGYPEIYYGYSPYSGAASRPMAAPLELPSPVSALPEVALSTSYTTSGLSTSNSNLAYDTFLTPVPLSPPGGPCATWCGTGLQPPAGCTSPPSDVLEVMIWLAHSSFGSTGSGYQPATGSGSPVGRYSATVGFQGAGTRSTFDEWACIYGQPECDAPTSHSIVSFVLSGVASSVLPNGLLNGTISIALNGFLTEAVRLASQEGAAGFSDADYLNAIELGAEMSPCPLPSTNAINFDFKLSSYCYLFGALSAGSPVGQCPLGAPAPSRPLTYGWSNVSSSVGAPPPARSGASMVYEAVDGYTLLFGGQDAAGKALGDTWALSDGRWSQLHTARSPSPRQDAGIAYDAADGYVLLFGGSGCGGMCDDTWMFKGGQWEELVVPSSPGPRLGAAMTYDAADGYVLLFAGSNLDSTRYYNDTWSFRHGRWSDSPRYLAARPGLGRHGLRRRRPVCRRLRGRERL